MSNNGQTHQHTSFEAARLQAADFLGLVASERITVGDKVFEIPNPSLIDDDQQERIDALDLDVDLNWERHPDILNEDGTVKQRGALKVPHRKNGVAMNYNIETAKALLGDRYPEFKQAGGRASDVAVIWSKMRVEMEKRREEDPFRPDGDSTVEAVRDSDRGGSEAPAAANS